MKIGLPLLKAHVFRSPGWMVGWKSPNTYLSNARGVNGVLGLLLEKTNLAQPVAAPRNRWRNAENAVGATFSARRRPHLRQKNRPLDRRLARHVRLPPKPTLRGPFLKGLSDAGEGTLERPDAGDAGNAGDAGEVSVFKVFFEGRTTFHKPVARPGRSGMFWGPSVWAGLRAGDAGNAEEELGVQQSTSTIYPTGRVALARRSSSKTHSAAGFSVDGIH